MIQALLLLGCGLAAYAHLDWLRAWYAWWRRAQSLSKELKAAERYRDELEAKQ